MTPYVEQIITERDSLAAHDEAVNGMGIYGYTADRMQAAYQAGEATAREDLTIAYMSGYHKGRDSMKAECVKVCEEQYEYYGYDHIFAKKIKELK